MNHGLSPALAEARQRDIERAAARRPLLQRGTGCCTTMLERSGTLIARVGRRLPVPGVRRAGSAQSDVCCA